MALYLQMKKKDNAGVDTKKRLRKLFIKKKNKFRRVSKKPLRVAYKVKQPKKITKFRRRNSKKNIKLHIKTYKFLNVSTKQPIVTFNKLRQLFMLYTKRRMFFRKKPYNYKLRKIRQPRWFFKYNKRKGKRFQKNPTGVKSLIRKKMLIAIKKNSELIMLLKLKRKYLMKKYANAPLLKPGKYKKHPIIIKGKPRRVARKKRKKKFKKWTHKRKSKMKILLKRIKVIAHYKQ